MTPQHVTAIIIQELIENKMIKLYHKDGTTQMHPTDPEFLDVVEQLSEMSYNAISPINTHRPLGSEKLPVDF